MFSVFSLHLDGFIEVWVWVCVGMCVGWWVRV